jgi:hypothetical protein
MDAFTFYTKIVPYFAAIVTALLVLSALMVPRTVWKIVFAKVMRRRVAAVFLSNDDGYTYLDMMKGDMGQGILKGEKANYIFTPRVTVSEVPFTDEEGKTQMKQMFDIPSEDKAALDSLIQRRHHMDFGVPVYFGYLGKSTAMNPTLLYNLEESDKELSNLQSAEELGLDPDKPTYTVNLQDPRNIKKYIPWTINPSMIDSIEFKAEQYGYLGRPLIETLKKFALPGGVLVALVALYLIYQKGLI